MTERLIFGAGGGAPAGPSTPTVAADDIATSSTAIITDLLCEGPIFGLVSGAKSIYLDGTAAQASSGSFNFTGFVWDSRTGTQSQTAMPTFGSSVASDTTVNVPTTQSGGPTTRTITAGAINSLKLTIQIPALQVLQSNGDVTGNSVNFQISLSVNGGPYTVYFDQTINGKSSVPFQRQYLIPVAGNQTYNLRLTRITADGTSQSQSSLYFYSYSTITNVALRYPNSAVTGVSFDAKYFQSIPARTYDVKGLIIRIPANATVDSNGGIDYSGVWDGTYQLAWCSDPAWCLFDFLTNTRYGCGIADTYLDKTAFYTVSQYNNGMVPDGNGGYERRFSLNAYLRSEEDAYTLVQSIASSMRCTTYWSSGGLTLVQDSPGTVTRQVTAANIKDGRFEYNSTALRTRYTAAVVVWNDPQLAYNQGTPQVYQYTAGFAKYGYKDTNITAFGTTSKGQAWRLGAATILANQLETDTVTFTQATEAIDCRPGDIIRALDTIGLGSPNSGLVANSTVNSITIDRSVTLGSGTYNLYIYVPTSKIKQTLYTRTLSNAPGTTNTFVFPSVPTAPDIGSAWSLILVGSDPSATYKVLAVSEGNGDAGQEYTIVASRYNPSKFALIDATPTFTAAPTQTKPDSPPNIPRNVAGTVAATGTTYTLTATWDYPLSGGNKDLFTSYYLVQYRMGGSSNNPWSATVNAYNQTTQWTVPTGTYQIRVASVDVLGNQSAWVTSGSDAALTAPTITSFTPTSVAPGGTVTLSGTNLIGCSFKVNGVAVAASSLTAFSVTLTIPLSGVTTGPVSVISATGTVVTGGTLTINYPAPTITSVTPSTASVGTVLTVTGTNLASTTGVTFDSGGAPTTALFVVLSNTSLQVTVPNVGGVGAFNLNVTTLGGSATY